jgi:hypothetical protein
MDVHLDAKNGTYIAVFKTKNKKVSRKIVVR